MRRVSVFLFAVALGAALLSASCTQVDFDNPLDPNGTNYLYGDKSCEEEKIKDSDRGAGLFTKYYEILARCGNGSKD